MAMTPEAALAAALDAWPAGPICIGFSGGLDSTALTHALASNDAARSRGLRCVHVDHRLHPDSATWAARCEAYAQSLSLPFESIAVLVSRGAGEGLEGAARTARYGAFEAALADGEILVTAHHADDQAETLLLRLVRGAGVAGLAAMRALRPFAAGSHARPWLDVPRDEIRAYAERHALRWIDDPSNANVAQDRNFLRAELLPLLESRWPQARRSLSRSAILLRETATLLDRTIARELELARDTQATDPARSTLRAEALGALDPYTRAEVVRAWIASLGLPSPPASTFDALDTLLDAREDGEPRLAWHGAELRRYRGRVHAFEPMPVLDPAWSSAWDLREPLTLPASLGTLVAEWPGSPPPSSEWTSMRVAFRGGGERIKLASSRPARPVKDLLQELGVPPWERDRIPFVFDGDALVAIADLIAIDGFPARIRWSR